MAVTAEYLLHIYDMAYKWNYKWGLKRSFRVIFEAKLLFQNKSKTH